MLRICNTIKKDELDKLNKNFSLTDIKNAYLKAKGGIGNNLGKVDSGVLLRKVYLTSTSSSGRIIFLFFVNKNIFIPIILRLKSDKIIGNNLSMNNKNFIELLNKNIDKVKVDLENNNYEDFNI